MSASEVFCPRVLVLAADWNEPTWRAQSARERLRRLTRVALRELAAPNPPESWPKDANGAPGPLADGRRWSVSHAGGFAAAALAEGTAIGIDVENMTRVPSENVRTRLRRMGARTRGDRDALRAWCAVEAVIKSRGLGIAHLSRVRFHGDALLFDDELVPACTFEARGAVLAVAGPGADRLTEPEVRRVGAEVAV